MVGVVIETGDDDSLVVDVEPVGRRDRALADRVIDDVPARCDEVRWDELREVDDLTVGPQGGMRLPIGPFAEADDLASVIDAQRHAPGAAEVPSRVGWSFTLFQRTGTLMSPLSSEAPLFAAPTICPRLLMPLASLLAPPGSSANSSGAPR